MVKNPYTGALLCSALLFLGCGGAIRSELHSSSRYYRYYHDFSKSAVSDSTLYSTAEKRQSSGQKRREKFKIRFKVAPLVFGGIISVATGTQGVVKYLGGERATGRFLMLTSAFSLIASSVISLYLGNSEWRNMRKLKSVELENYQLKGEIDKLKEKIDELTKIAEKSKKENARESDPTLVSFYVGGEEAEESYQQINSSDMEGEESSKNREKKLVRVKVVADGFVVFRWISPTCSPKEKKDVSNIKQFGVFISGSEFVKLQSGLWAVSYPFRIPSFYCVEQESSLGTSPENIFTIEVPVHSPPQVKKISLSKQRKHTVLRDGKVVKEEIDVDGAKEKGGQDIEANGMSKEYGISPPRTLDEFPIYFIEKEWVKEKIVQVERIKNVYVGVKKNEIITSALIIFRKGSWRLTQSSKIALVHVASYIMRHPEIKKIEIQGWASPEGPESLNLWLSRKRAEEVRRHLIRLGVEPSRLIARGMGEAPVDEKGAETWRAVKFIILERKED